MNFFSINIAYDAQGTPDTRPNTWGDAAYFDSKVPFINVPEGHRVRITRVYGDHIAWPHGKIADGTMAGVLFGIITSSSGQSPFVAPGLGSSGCFLYIQQGVGSVPARAPFDFDVSLGGLLDADHVATFRQAVYLNETGVSIHQEVTMVVEFEYEAAP